MSRNVMISIRLDRQLYDELMKLENYSDYIRNLIIKDMEQKAEPQFIENRIKELNEEISRLKSCATEKAGQINNTVS